MVMPLETGLEGCKEFGGFGGEQVCWEIIDQENETCKS